MVYFQPTAASRRGDIEILGLVLLHWLCGELPWESCLTNANKVRDMKSNFLDDIKANVKNLLPDETPGYFVKNFIMLYKMVGFFVKVFSLM